MAKAAQNPTTGIKNSLKLWAFDLGLEHQENCQLGCSGEYGTGYVIAEKLVLSKVKVLLGLDDCKFCFTGAAPIKTETLQFYGRLGLNINEVYGMSECTGATTWSTDLAHKWGSCGWAMPSCEVSVRSKTTGKEVPDGNDGEICYRGRHIMMGYMANKDLGEEHMKTITGKNRDSIDQYGWLHSGDKGQRDVDGMIKITGRYKELIIGAGGENVAPVRNSFFTLVLLLKKRSNWCCFVVGDECLTWSAGERNVERHDGRTGLPMIPSIEVLHRLGELSNISTYKLKKEFNILWNYYNRKRKKKKEEKEEEEEKLNFLLPVLPEKCDIASKEWLQLRATLYS